MKIGIDASRAFQKNLTGIEEYSFQIVKHLVEQLQEHKVVLYVRKSREASLVDRHHWITNSKNLEIRAIDFHRLWTQIGLAFEQLFNPVDVLFVPAHTVPWVHPKKTVVTIHGLEYEHCPQSYSLFSRFLHRFFIKKSCRWAKKIIAVSKKTKRDLFKIYNVSRKKIKVVYNGYRPNINVVGEQIDHNYILYIGRIEIRKNVKGIIDTFKILKEKYGYQGKLILAGKPGHGYEKIKKQISKIDKETQAGIVEKGFISNKEKQYLMKNADVFLFPSFCEGFGIPILEAQAAGTPVITSDLGPMDEVAGRGGILVNPHDSEMIARLANRLTSDEEFHQKVSTNGLNNIKRFSWKKSSKDVENVLLSI